MNPLIADIHDKELAILVSNANADAKINRVRHLAMILSEMALKDDKCLQIMENAAAKMSVAKYASRIVVINHLATSKL